jgi:drug/metabolite transporter (DMT)-like permease
LSNAAESRAGDGALPWIAFAAISFIWGSTWLAHKWALQDFTPIGLMTTRLLIAAVACFALGRLRREPFPLASQLKHILIAGVILTALANVATAWSLTHIPSGVGAVLQAPIPVWMALFSLRSDPLSKTGWLAAILGLGGVILVSIPESLLATGHSDINWWPSLVCIGAAASWSWASLYQRKHVSSGGLMTNASIQMLQGGMLGLILVAFGAPITTHGSVSAESWYSLAYLVIFGSCIAFAAYLYLTQVWHPARAGSFSYLNPVVAVALGVWLGGEPLQWRTIIGLGVILLAVAVLQYATIRRARQDAKMALDTAAGDAGN